MQPETGTETEGTETETETETVDESTFDDAAKKALAAVRADAKKARKEAQTAKAKVAELTPKAQQYDSLAAASQTEQQRQQAQITAAEAKASEANARIVRAEVKALASANFADPEDASAFLDLDTYIGDDGEVDTTAITSDLAELLTRKPHLARGDRPIIKPDPTQGSSGRRTSTSTPGEEFAAILRGQLGSQ